MRKSHIIQSSRRCRKHPLKPPPAQLEQDTAEFLAIRERLLSEDITTSVAPLNSRLLTNTDKNPFSDLYMSYQALQTLGYEVHLIDNAEWKDSTQDASMVAVYVDDADWQAIEEISSSLSDTTYGKFLSAATQGNICTFSLNPDHSAHEQTLQELLPHESRERAVRLMARGFLTSTILGNIEIATKGEMYSWRIKNESRELYTKVSAQGVKPFNVEELYGMATGVVREALAASPDIAPPASKRRDGFEY